MPYRSAAQQRLFHAKAARGEISPAVVAEFDAATNFKKLPERVRRSPRKSPAPASSRALDPRRR